MVALLVGMSIAAIWMTAALPAWRQQVQRQREEDLIFRGEQYARAIVLFQDKNQGALPPSIDVLVSQHFLRKKWKDPITNDEFVPVGTGGLVGAPGSGGAQTPQTGRGAQAGVQPGAQSPGQAQQPPGITGVRSKSSATSVKIYQNQQQHNLWQFDANLVRARMGRQAINQGGGRPGQPGGRDGGAGGRGRQAPGVGPQPPRGGGAPIGGGRGGGAVPPPGIGRGRGQ
jgi:type II secretory pathway pseudopilin PulG